MKKGTTDMGYIQVTRKCNRDCVFCSNPRVDDELTLDEIKEQIHDYMRKGVNDIVFTGGEPTLNESLPDAISYCKSINLECRIITNGQRLAEPEYAKTLGKSGLNNVMVSIYSHVPEKEERLTATPGSFSNTLKAIGNVSRYICPPKINIAINSLNAQDLDKTVRFLCESFPDIPHFTFNFIDPGVKVMQGNEWTVPRYIDTELSLPRTFNYLLFRGKTFRIERVPLCYLPGFEHLSSETRRIVKEQAYRCLFLDEPGRELREITNFYYEKGEACESCSLNEICCGLNPRYVKIHGMGEIFPAFVKKEDVISRVMSEV
jgi:MoaA/NifB/PqqE/SkfB family radical SAM enzyme